MANIILVEYKETQNSRKAEKKYKKAPHIDETLKNQNPQNLDIN